ncbi:MAG: SCO family protein [Rubrivivax sp.]
MRRFVEEHGLARAATAAACALLLLGLNTPAAAADASAAAPTAAAAIAAPLDSGAREKAGDRAGALDENEALRLSQAAIGRAVPDLTLLDREGRPVRLSAYRGKPLLVSFIYTGCFTVCPTQTRTLAEAVAGLDRMVGPGQFNVVSIGFNQPFDDPGAMRSFARQHRIDRANWEFLSPPRDTVRALTEAFGFSYVATPAGFEHLVGVTVVDADGRIHAQVYGERLRADQLGRPLRELLLDAPWPAEARSTLAAVVERVRILCTVYDPDTGEYRYDWKLIFELFGGLFFFGSVAIYLLLDWRDRRRARRALPCPAPASNPSGSAA